MRGHKFSGFFCQSCRTRTPTGGFVLLLFYRRFTQNTIFFLNRPKVPYLKCTIFEIFAWKYSFRSRNYLKSLSWCFHDIRNAFGYQKTSDFKALTQSSHFSKNWVRFSDFWGGEWKNLEITRKTKSTIKEDVLTGSIRVRNEFGLVLGMF